MIPRVEADSRVPRGVLLFNPRSYMRAPRWYVEYHEDGSATVHVESYVPVALCDGVVSVSERAE